MTFGRTVFATFKGDDKFIYAVSRIRVLETRLLDKDIIEDLMDAGSLQEIYRILSDTEYAEVLKDLDETPDYERLMDWELRRVNSLIFQDSPEPYLTDLFHLRYDCQNAKRILKAKYLGEEVDAKSLSPSGLLEPEEVINLIMEENYYDMPEWFADAVKAAQKVYEEKGEFGLIESEIDKHMRRRQLKISNKYPYPFLIKYFTMLIDIANIRTFFRMKLSADDYEIERYKLYFINRGELEFEFFTNMWDLSVDELTKHFDKTDYGRIIEKFLSDWEDKKSLVPMDTLSRKFVFEVLAAGKLITFGIEPVIHYLIRKESEIAVLRAIMALKSVNVDPNTIRERIAESFG